MLLCSWKGCWRKSIESNELRAAHVFSSDKAYHMITRLMILFLCASVQVSAQSPYRPFPESNAGWVEEHGWLQPLMECGDYEYISCTRPVYFGADTVIGGNLYHRLLTHGLCYWQLTDPTQTLPPWCSGTSGYYAEPGHEFAYIRQDTMERKVYIFDVQTGAEELLYDFTISTGPYPATYNNPYPGNVSVVALDSMELNDGWHRTWVLGWEVGGSIDSAFCKVIEGIGSTYGILSTLAPPFENGDWLECHAVAGNGIYPLGSTGCNLAVGIAPQAQWPVIDMTIQPNPTDRLVTVTGEFQGKAAYRVMDPSGRLLKQGYLDDGRIDLEPLAPSLYVVQILSAEGRQIATARILKVDQR